MVKQEHNTYRTIQTGLSTVVKEKNTVQPCCKQDLYDGSSEHLHG